MESLHGAFMVPHNWPDPAMDNRPLNEDNEDHQLIHHVVALDDDDLFNTDTLGFVDSD